MTTTVVTTAVLSHGISTATRNVAMARQHMQAGILRIRAGRAPEQTNLSSHI